MNEIRKSQCLAWLAIAIASDLADICWYLRSGHRLPPIAVILRAALLLPIAVVSRDHLRGFVVALTAFLAGSWIQRGIERSWMWFQQAPVSWRVYADAWLALIPSALIALTLLRSGLSRRDIYLTPGDLRARFAGLGRVRWNWLAPLVIFLMIFGLSAQLKFILAGASATVKPNWFSLTVLSVTFAAINAANEEFRFRFVLVARGMRAVGPSAALWMTALNFGLAHWVSGHPGGPTGVLTTTLFGLLLARNLYDTRGGLWAWLMHASSDIIIFVVVLLRVG